MEGRTDGRTDGRTLPAKAGGPKKGKILLEKKRQLYKRILSFYDAVASCKKLET